MALEIRPVGSRRELTTFIKLPFRLYRGEPNWVPPLIYDRRRFLDRGMQRGWSRREEARLADRHCRWVIGANYIGTLKSCPQKLWKSLWKLRVADGLSLVRLVASSVLHSVTAA